MEFGWQIAKIIFYLALVVGLIYFVSFLLKKGVLKSRQGKYMNVIDRLSLTPKMSLNLIQVKNRVILLSIGDKKIEKISEWKLSEFQELNEQEIESSEDFQGYLNKFLRVSRRDEDD